MTYILYSWCLLKKFMHVAMSSPVVLSSTQHVKFHIGILCGCTIYMIWCYNCFLFSSPLPLIPRDDVSLTDCSIKIFLPITSYFSPINWFILSILFPTLARVSPNNWFVQPPLKCYFSVFFDLYLWPVMFV